MPMTDNPSPDIPLYDAWCVIANARDWLIDDEQAQQWRTAAERWRDRNGFGGPVADAVAGSAAPTGDVQQYADDFVDAGRYDELAGSATPTKEGT